MDPFSIISGVASLAAVTVQAIQTFIALIKGIRNAETELKTLLRGVNDFHVLAISLRAILGNAELQRAIQHDRYVVELIETLKLPLQSCQDLIARIIDKINGRRPGRSPGAFGLSRVRGSNLRWALYLKRDMNELQTCLDGAKLTLCTALGAVNL